jgi:hypothetical protein
LKNSGQQDCAPAAFPGATASIAEQMQHTLRTSGTSSNQAGAVTGMHNNPAANSTPAGGAQHNNAGSLTHAQFAAPAPGPGPCWGTPTPPPPRRSAATEASVLSLQQVTPAVAGAAAASSVGCRGIAAAQPAVIGGNLAAAAGDGGAAAASGRLSAAAPVFAPLVSAAIIAAAAAAESTAAAKQQLQQLGAHVPSPIQEALQHQGPPQGLVGGTGISGLCLASQPVLLPVAQV